MRREAPAPARAGRPLAEHSHVVLENSSPVSVSPFGGVLGRARGNNTQTLHIKHLHNTGLHIKRLIIRNTREVCVSCVCKVGAGAGRLLDEAECGAVRGAAQRATALASF